MDAGFQKAMSMDPNAQDPSWWHSLPFVLAAGQQHRGSVKSITEAVIVAMISGALGGGLGVYVTVQTMRTELTLFKEAIGAVVVKLEARDAILEQRIYELQIKREAR
jgi:N-acyl-L-homoserine lactone synthetase